MERIPSLPKHLLLFAPRVPGLMGVKHHFFRRDEGRFSRIGERKEIRFGLDFGHYQRLQGLMVASAHRHLADGSCILHSLPGLDNGLGIKRLRLFDCLEEEHRAIVNLSYR